MEDEGSIGPNDLSTVSLSFKNQFAYAYKKKTFSMRPPRSIVLWMLLGRRLNILDHFLISENGFKNLIEFKKQ